MNMHETVEAMDSWASNIGWEALIAERQPRNWC